MNRHAWLFAFFAAAIALPAACTFPPVTFGPSGSSSSGAGSNGGASSTTVTTSNGGNTSTQNTGGNGASGLGGQGASSAGGQGMGGATSSGGSGGGGPCPMAADPCDCDNDGYRRDNCGDQSKPGGDCADNDARAHPMATKAWATPIHDPLEPGVTLYFDFDCDGVEKPTYHVLKCGGVGSCNYSQGWAVGTTQIECGSSGDLYNCSNGLGCTYGEVGTTAQSCL